MAQIFQLSDEDLGANQPLLGATAFDANGERLGSVDAVLGGDETRRPSFLVVASGSLLRTRQFVVPAGTIERLDPEQHSVSLTDVTKAQLGSEPYPLYDNRWRASNQQDTLASSDGAAVLDGVPARTAAESDRTARPLLPATEGAVTQMQLLEERMSVRSERIEAGTVRITKRVTTRTETVEVPLTEVHLVIERAAGDGGIVVDGRELQDGETVELPIYSERAQVTKEPVIAECVSIRTETGEHMEQVTETLRREELVVDQTADGLVTVTNAAGAAGAGALQ